AIWTFEGITSFITAHLPHGAPPIVMNFAPDLRVFGYAVALTICTGVLFGLVPALIASRTDVGGVLQDEGMGLGARTARGLMRQSLVGVQIAVSMMLLIAAGLCLRALNYAQTIDPGFEMANIVTVDIDLRSQGYDNSRAAAFHRRLHDRMAALPGVDNVAQT